MAIKELNQSFSKSAPAAVAVGKPYHWGWAPLVSIASASGLFLVALANSLSTQGAPRADLFFWTGLILLVLPIGLRLTSVNASRRERLALLVLLGLLLYWVKVMHSPYAFNFADEFVHEYNATQILQQGKLFSPNPIITITPSYPGLEIVTSALASLSGLSIFTSGLIIVGLSRLILMLALFLFFEQVSDSQRIAGLAAMLYVCNSNFLYWSAQYSYESMTLPLALMILFIIARRERSEDNSEFIGFTIVAILGIAAIVVSHHLSAYFLAIFMTVWVVLITSGNAIRSWFDKKLFVKWKLTSPDAMENGPVADSASKTEGPGWLIIIPFALLAVWLSFVAGNTVDYLVPVLKAAFQSIIDIVKGTQAPRQLFQSNTGYVAPVWQRYAGLLSIALLASTVPFGLKRFWKEYQRNRVALMLVAMGSMYFAMLGLRFSPQAWETGNRASEYLFIGLSFLVAIAGVELWRLKSVPWIGKVIFAVGISIIFLGGVIAGWPPRLIMQQPSLVEINSHMIEPQGTAVARLFLSQYGPGNRMGADPANARLLLSVGNQFAYEGRHPDVREIIDLAEFADWQRDILKEESIRYIVMDRRSVSRDNMAGYFFDAIDWKWALNAPLIEQAVFDKFNNVPYASRIMDSGTVTIYDFIKLLEKKQDAAQ